MNNSMMNLYTFTVTTHVVTAILGLGPVVGTAILASSGRPGTPVGAETLTALKRLALATTLALAVLVLSGALIEYSTSGGFHESRWFQLSFVLAVALGVLQGRIRSALRTLEPGVDGRGLRGIARIAWTMCSIVAVITVLMEVKPW